MRRWRRQEGQALIAALVVMVVLFSVAGGLAVAVSAALDSGSSSGTYLRDVTAQSSSAAVLARVAGRPGNCPTGTLFGSVSGYGCDEIDAVSPSQAAMVKLVGDRTCATAPLPASRHVAVWLHSISGAASLRVDSSSSCGGSSGCAAGSGAPSGSDFFYTIRDCALSPSATAYVHVSDPSGSATVARFAALASLLPKFNPAPAGPAPAPILAAHLRGVTQPIDLLVGDRAGGISELENRGDGYFPNVAATYLASTPIATMILADLEGNGSQYLIAGSALGNAVTILRGRGDGSFQALQSYSVNDPPTTLAAGHFTGSANVNLVAGSLTGRSITLLFGNGDGTFQPATTRTFSSLTVCSGCPTLSPVAVALLDLPGGQVLLAVATAEGWLLLYDIECTNLCDAGGGLKLIAFEPLGGTPTAMVKANLNGDDYPDLAVTLPNQVDVFFGQGYGLAAGGTVPVGSSLSAIAAGNLGGSGLDDLAVTDAATNTVTALLNDGRGTLQPALGGPADTGAQPTGVVTGDFSGTGLGALAVTNLADNSVSVLFRNRSRVFTVVGAGPPGTTNNESDLVWADLAPSNRLLFEGGLS